MKFDLDSTLFLLLLLAELLDRTCSRPVLLCAVFRPAVHQLDTLVNMSEQLHGLSDEELHHLTSEENHLESLPHMQYDAGHFRTIKMNESLSRMFVDAHSFKLHVDWLTTAKENNSLPAGAAEDASGHLHRLSGLLTSALQPLNVTLPVTSYPSLPVVSTAFDVLKFSIEISERLKIFCRYSKRVFRVLQKSSRCPR